MAEAGWYPDPSGDRGRYRYWDGEQWSAQTNTFDATAPITVSKQSNADEPVTEVSGWQRFKGPVMIVGLALVTIVAMIWGLTQIGVLGGDRRGPGSNPTEFCPQAGPGNFSVDPHPSDGRVYGGGISYPRLGAPWSAPKVDGRVPFGRDVQTQTITIEQEYRPGQDWVASVLVGELVDGDGFVSPEAGIEMVARCIVGAFYGEDPVQRRDVQSRATTVDGREAYLLEMYLSFDIRGLQAKGETALIVIVSTGVATNSIYYASIPENSPEYLPVARDLVGQLRVS